MKPGYLIKNNRSWSHNLWSLGAHCHDPQVYPSSITGECLSGELAIIIEIDEHSIEAKILTCHGAVGWVRMSGFDVVRSYR